MSILSLFIKGGEYNTSDNIREIDEPTLFNIGGLYRLPSLPIIAIPRSIIAKMEYKKLDYKEIVASLPLRSSYEVIDDSIDGGRVSLSSVIGMEDAISVYALTSKLLTYGDSVNKSIYRIIDFTLSENDYKNEVTKIANHLSARSSSGLYSRAYDIESDNNGFYIIMNDNSFTDYDSMYKELSRELCVRMLQSIDESFVYRSVFFKAL